MDDGKGLLRELIEATGLPGHLVEKEINRLAAKHGLNPKALTLDDVRELLASYLQDVLSEAKLTY